jgi:hypothetical protein
VSKTRSFGPWMVAGLALAAAVNPGLTREGTTVAATTAAARQAASAARPAAHGSSEEDEIDTLDTIGESLAVDLSTDGLRRRATRSVTVLQPRTKSTPAQQQHAVAFLRAFFDLPIRQTDGSAEAKKAALVLDEKYRRDPASTASTTFATAVATITTFLTGYFDEDALSDKDAKKDAILLARDFEHLDKTALKIAVLEQILGARKSKVSFLIGTLPDPIDSYTGWQFDPMLDAIAQAVAASDYVLDRFHFPDSDKDEAPASRATGEAGRLHELEPGVVVFRKHVEPQQSAEPQSTLGDRLVLLVVHENPAAGVHARALANAIRLVTRCAPLTATDGGTMDSTVRILGPTFSGSSESLNRALGLAENRLRGYTVRVLSGSATDPQNQSTIESGLPRGTVTFHATVHPDDVLLPSLVKQIKDAGWSSRVAVLFEANTQYGRQLWEVLSRQRSEEGAPLDFIQLPFPMNVSRLRTTVQARDPARSGLLGLPSKFRPLLMESQGNPSDQIPQFNPETTATYVELAMAGMLETMGRERVKTVALMATDPRDKLFLAQQIDRYSPDVSIVTAESDSLYIHPDYSSYLRGALVVSTYPLYSGNQRWSYGYQGDAERRQFANGSAQGIYNAALALLNYNEDGQPIVEGEDPPPPLLEYGVPGESCAEACRPPVWISVVGRSSAWPIRAYPADPTSASTYVFAVAPTARLRPPRVFPSATFDALLLLLTFAILAGWVVLGQGRTTAGRTRLSWTGNDGEPASRAYLLVCVMGVLLIQTFIWMLSLIRVSIEGGSGWAVPALIAASVGLLAACHMTARVLAPIVRENRQAFRPGESWRRLSTWAVVGAVAIGAWSLLNVVLYLGGHAVREWSNVGFLARALDFGSGVCPTLPVLFLGSALTLWGVTELSRVGLGRVALAEPSVHVLLQEMVYADVQKLKAPWDLLNRSILSVPPGGVAIAAFAFVATCIFVFDPFRSWLVTIEGRYFGRFVSAALLLVQVMLTLALVQFVFLWKRIQQLLELMARHDYAEAYERVPREMFPTDLFPNAPRLVDLQVIVAHWERLVSGGGAAAPVLQEIPDAALSLDATFRQEMRSAPETRWSASATWAVLLETASLVASRRRTGADAAARELLQREEELPAMLIAFVLRDALARLAHNLLFVIGGVVLVFCSYMFFPFQQHTQLQFLGWIYIGITFTAILTVLVQIKRNEIVASLTATTPGSRSTWDSAFVLKVTVFALLPLFALFAAQFPEIGGLLLRWIEPVQKALP